jgi:Na+-translocating ferredoxin:NAD+ oxidoreductase RnfC subunit
MQSLGFSMGPVATLAATLSCCECNLCSLFACPEDLDPKTICAQAKQVAREQGITFKDIAGAPDAHPMAEFRRVPMRRLIARLGLGEFKNEGPLSEHHFAPRHVKILLKQHAGAPATPVVKSGDRVQVGDLLAAMEPGTMGAPVHASIDGSVTVSKDAMVIDA